MNELNFRQMPQWMPEALEIQMLVDVWAQAYEVPREAVIRQIPIAYAWAMSNKKKAPKKRVTRFLHTFMKKAKEFGNLTVKSKDVYREEKPDSEVMTAEDFQRMRENIGRKK